MPPVSEPDHHLVADDLVLLVHKVLEDSLPARLKRLPKAMLLHTVFVPLKLFAFDSLLNAFPLLCQAPLSAALLPLIRLWHRKLIV
jgi:hypothetical protein